MPDKIFFVKSFANIKKELLLPQLRLNLNKENGGFYTFNYVYQSDGATTF